MSAAQYPTVVINGATVDFAAAVNLMDDDIREQLHNNLAPCTNQEFADAYTEAHLEKHGEQFQVN